MARYIEIDGRKIGNGNPCYIIAELSGNHHRDKSVAMEMIHAAKEAGADAVKLQHYTADTLTVKADNKYLRMGDKTIWEVYNELWTPWEWTADLKAEAERHGLALFSSPFDPSAVEFLAGLDVPAYKIASFEIVDHILLKAVARQGKPVIMSTGMATLAEIEEALEILRGNGASQIALLKCTSSYPAPAEEMNLRTIPMLRELFRVPAGLSDHTTAVAAPVASVALGASIIEKHFILDRASGGPESGFALEPDEFKRMVDEVRQAEAALGSVHFGPEERERASLALRRSLFVVKDIAEGETFTDAHIRSVRPSHGLHTRHYEDVIGRAACKPVEAGTPLDWSQLA